MLTTNGMGPLPADDIIRIHISDTVTRGTVKPTYPVIRYSHNREVGGDAIANGFVYRGKLIPALDKLVFGDITTGRDLVLVRNRPNVRPRPTTATRRPSRGLSRLTPVSVDHRRDLPRARRRSTPQGWQWLPGPCGCEVCGRQRRRALRPDQE